jgi:hypothetical protein
VTRLFSVERAWLSFPDRAKATVARANIAAEHEGGGTIRPAFEDVGAVRFLTNSMKVQTLDQLQDVILIRRIAQTNLQPLRLWQTRLWAVSYYSKFARQNVGSSV